MTTLAEMKKALEAATPGPLFTVWSEAHETLEITCEARKGAVGVAQIETGFIDSFDAVQKANARLIVEAVNNLPALLKVVEAAQAFTGAQCMEDRHGSYHALREALEVLNDE